MARKHRRRRRRRGSLGPLLRVLSVLLMAIAIVAALTLFFKVNQVSVSGNERYSAQEIIEVSGVEQGDNLILMDKYRIAEKLYTKLPYITEAVSYTHLMNTARSAMRLRSPGPSSGNGKSGPLRPQGSW